MVERDIEIEAPTYFPTTKIDANLGTIESQKAVVLSLGPEDKALSGNSGGNYFYDPTIVIDCVAMHVARSD